MQKKILWFMCGLPAAGKTSLIKRYFPTYKTIRVDDYDTEYLFQKALIETLTTEKSMVIDGCFETKEGRVQTLTNILNYTHPDISYEINFCVLQTGLYECLERNSNRQMLPNKIITSQSIEERAHKFEDPITDGLPYSNVMYVDPYGNLLRIVQGEQFR